MEVKTRSKFKKKNSCDLDDLCNTCTDNIKIIHLCKCSNVIAMLYNGKKPLTGN